MGFGDERLAAPAGDVEAAGTEALEPFPLDLLARHHLLVAAQGADAGDLERGVREDVLHQAGIDPLPHVLLDEDEADAVLPGFGDDRPGRRADEVLKFVDEDVVFGGDLVFGEAVLFPSRKPPRRRGSFSNASGRACPRSRNMNFNR